MKFTSSLLSVAVVFVIGAFCTASPGWGQVTWITPGSGDWNTGGNWSSGIVPDENDDVVIDVAGVIQVSLETNAAARSLQSQEDLLFAEHGLPAGQRLTVHQGGFQNGVTNLGTSWDLVFTGGTFDFGDRVDLGENAWILAANNAIVNFNGDVSSQPGGDIDAITGATINFNGPLDLRNLTVSVSGGSQMSATGINNLNLTGYGRITNKGGHVDLSNIQTVTGSGTSTQVTIWARSFQGADATVDLSSLTDVSLSGGFFRIAADGLNSSVDLSALTTTSGSPHGATFLSVSDGATMDASSLTSMSQEFGAHETIKVDGADSVLTLGNLQSIRNGGVFLNNGAYLDFSNVQDITGTSFWIGGGINFDVSQINSFDTAVATRWSAGGENSVLDLSGIQTITSTRQAINVSAGSGGRVDLSSLESLDGGLSVLSSGANAIVDLSSWQQHAGSRGRSHLDTRSGGQILLDSRSTSELRFNRVDITSGTGGIINPERIVQFDHGTFTSNGNNHVFGITSATASSFIANNAVLDVRSLSGTVTGSPIFSVVRMRYEANGENGQLDLSNVQEFRNSEFAFSRLNVVARNGGTVDLSGVQSAISPFGSEGRKQPISVSASGSGSLVNLTSLTRFQDLSSITESTISVSGGAEVWLAENAATDLTNIIVSVDAGSVLRGQEIRLLSENTPDVSGERDVDESVLSGHGTVLGNVTNVSGVVRPGSSPGRLTIDGIFEQQAGGRIEIEIDSLTSFDELIITGDAILAGTLAVNLDETYSLVEGNAFEIIDIDGVSSGRFLGLAQNSIVLSQQEMDLRIDYFGGDGNDVVLRASSVPEPGGLVVWAIMAGVFVRRRRHTC